jgi:hypothetical protein
MVEMNLVQIGKTSSSTSVGFASSRPMPTMRLHLRPERERLTACECLINEETAEVRTSPPRDQPIERSSLQRKGEARAVRPQHRSQILFSRNGLDIVCLFLTFL